MTEPGNEDNTTNLSGDSIRDLACFPDRYQSRGLIGQGAMGMVFHSYDQLLDCDVAIKIMLSELAGDPSVKERFLRETRALAALNHPNVVRILNSGLTEKGNLYYVMEFLAGESLAGELKKKQLLPPQRFHQIISQVIDGLSSIHALNIVHRDLKPGNIMLCRDSEGNCLVKIIDFGIARLNTTSEQGARRLTESNVALGSPAYMSPEQCQGAEVNHLSDIYSLGCIVYECLSGRPPFQGETAIETMYMQLNEQPAKLQFARNNKTTNRLADLVDRCLRMNPQERPQSAREIQTELTALFERQESEMSFPAGAPHSKAVSRLVIPGSIIACIILAGSIPAYVHLSCHTSAQRADLSASGKQAGGGSAWKTDGVSLFTRVKQLKGAVGPLLDSKPGLNFSAEEQQKLREFKVPLDKMIKEIEDRKSEKDKPVLFAALQLRFRILESLQFPASEQIACQKKALSVCGAGSEAARWCDIALAKLYLQSSNLKDAELSARLAATDSPDPDKMESIQPFEVPTDLWKWNGSDPQVEGAFYLGLVTCKQGDFERAKPHLASAEESERAAGHYGALEQKMLHKAQVFFNTGHRAEAIDALEKIDQELCRLKPDAAQELNDLPASFLQLERLASGFQDAERAQRFLKDGIDLCRRLKHPPQEEERLIQRLNQLRLQPES